MFEGVKVCERTKIIFVGAFLGLLLSKGMALIPGLGLDDYAALQQDRNPLFYISQGRYFQAVIQLILTNINISPTSIYWPVEILFFISAAVAITGGIVFTTRRQGSAYIQAGVAAIIGSHPYISEYFSFRESLITQGLSFLFLAVFFIRLLNIEKDNEIRFSNIKWLAIILVLIASTQQTVFLVALFFVLTRFAIDTTYAGGIKYVGRALRANYALFSIFAISAVIYGVIFFSTGKLFNISGDGRGNLIGVIDFYPRVLNVISLINNVMFEGEPVLSKSVKIVLLIAVFGSILRVGSKIPQAALIAVVLFSTLMLGSVILVAISKTWWPVPRAIYGVSFAFGLTLIYTSVFIDDWQKSFFSIISVSAIGLSFHSSSMLYDQYRLNRWDLWTAGKIVSDLTSRNVMSDKKLILVGAHWNYPVGLKTVEGDLNISALSVSWSVKYLIGESTGMVWDVTSVASNDICKPGLFWPSPESIHVYPEEVVVCMGSR